MSMKMLVGNDSIVSQSINLPNQRVFENIYNENVSSMFVQPNLFTRGEIGVGYRYEDNTKHHLLQEGQTYNQYGLIAKGVVLKENKIFWGDIGYQKSKRKGVQWSNVYDYSRLGPYVIADSIGGNVFGEQYRFSGGLAIQYDRWSLGGQASYTAGHNYRKSDPRPKSTSTDLLFQLSVGYDLFRDYQIGVSGEIGKYRQEITTLVVREKDRYYFFSLKGFGQMRPKISKYDSSFGWLYEGVNYRGSAYLLPKKGNGFVANFSIGYEYIDSNLGNDNIPYTYATYKTMGDLGWQHQDSDSRTLVKMSYGYTFSEGTERIYYFQKVNNVFGQNFLLTSGRFFARETTDLSLLGLHEWLSPKNVKWVQFSVGTASYEERYVYPRYNMKFTHLTSSIETGGEFRTKGASSFVGKFGLSYNPLLSSSKNLPDADESWLFQKSMEPNIEIWESSLFGVHAEIMYQYRLKNNTQIYTSANTNSQFAGSKNRLNLNFAIGVRY